VLRHALFFCPGGAFPGSRLASQIRVLPPAILIPPMNDNSAVLTAATAAHTLAGHVIMVTGGGRGLGAAICEVAGAAGARIALADVDAARAEDRAERLRSERVDATAFALDVCDEAQVRDTLATIKARFGRLDAVINNAAIDMTVPIAELSGEHWDRILRTNLTGPFLVARHAVPLFGDKGHIVNICSTAAKRAWPNASAYHATKWGLLGLSHALHAELRPRGIKVSAVVAGGMRTPFLLDRFPDIDPDVLQDPLHVARAVLFVLSQPDETVIPELMVLPMRETSWP
jgi:NAD(P)-dependent dehydrogenase (short-subunit alcohol dehydrogenase family)